jgi:Arc/MetJ-type ribon-helix-helix transcriptional regulator
MKSQSSPIVGEEVMPQRKPLNQHKRPMTVSLNPENREWIRDHFEEYGYRSESHAVDAAIDFLRKEISKEHKNSSGNESVGHKQRD